jgi:hypothetical protein
MTKSLVRSDDETGLPNLIDGASRPAILSRADASRIRPVALPRLIRPSGLERGT